MREGGEGAAGVAGGGALRRGGLDGLWGQLRASEGLGGVVADAVEEAEVEEGKGKGADEKNVEFFLLLLSK